MFCLESSSTENGQMLPPLSIRSERFFLVGREVRQAAGASPTNNLYIWYIIFIYIYIHANTCSIILAYIVAVGSFAWCFFLIHVFSSLRNDEAMAHRAGTGDQPIPGLVTSRVEPKFNPSIPR